MGSIEGGTRTALPVAFVVIFTQAARAELIGAQDWYEGEAAGLGRNFREAIDALTELPWQPRSVAVAEAHYATSALSQL